MNKRTPTRPHGLHQPMLDSSITAYLPSTEGHSQALAPEQIPLIDATDLVLPSAAEAAEALGMQQGKLTDEIRDEERQRHPEVPMNDQNPRD